MTRAEVRAARLTKNERELLQILGRGGTRGGVDVELSLKRGLCLVRWSESPKRDFLMTRLGDGDRRALVRFARLGWLHHHSDIDNGIILGLTREAAAYIGGDPDAENSGSLEGQDR